jgi:uncharacterized protein
VSTHVTTAVGTFVWHEHVSTQPAKAQEFYKQLLGWDYDVVKTGEVDYTVISSGGHGHGGFPPVPEGTPSHWVGNVQVEGADASAEKAKAAGGSVIVDPMDIGEVGRYAVIRDPQGGVLAVFQPAGDGPMGQGVFVWDELATSDVGAAKSFYGEVLGWTTRDMDMGGGFTYTIFKRSDDAEDANGVGGAMPQGEAPVTMWMPYVAADDIDATAAKVTELGGTVLREPWDIEGVGRISIIQDPTGAVLGLIRPQPRS